MSVRVIALVIVIMIALALVIMIVMAHLPSARSASSYRPSPTSARATRLSTVTWGGVCAYVCVSECVAMSFKEPGIGNRERKVRLFI